MSIPPKYLHFEEGQLVRLAQVGDDLAFEALVRLRQSLVRNFMRRLCNNVTLADDLAQLVFLSAWRAIGKLNDHRRYGAWLKAIAVNTWKQHLRQSANTELQLNNEALEASQQEYINENHGQKLDLDRSLQLLLPDARLCIILSFEWGMSHQEICEHTNLALGTVKSHLRRSMDVLQKAMEN